MQNISRFTVGFVSTLALFLVLQTVYTDTQRSVTLEDKAKVIETLKRNDCTAVKIIDYVEGSKFEAKNVKCNDGKEYDVFLDKNFNITSRQ